ncbi:hypothetical protein HDU81_001537 [Chytriomyces hyalinus]|nr:hypothetical protein HDU81_001537 [Chytriomyces hyalinus]
MIPSRLPNELILQVLTHAIRTGGFISTTLMALLGADHNQFLLAWAALPSKLTCIEERARRGLWISLHCFVGAADVRIFKDLVLVKQLAKVGLLQELYVDRPDQLMANLPWADLIGAVMSCQNTRCDRSCLTKHFKLYNSNAEVLSALYQQHSTDSLRFSSKYPPCPAAVPALCSVFDVHVSLGFVGQTIDLLLSSAVQDGHLLNLLIGKFKPIEALCFSCRDLKSPFLADCLTDALIDRGVVSADLPRFCNEWSHSESSERDAWRNPPMENGVVSNLDLLRILADSGNDLLFMKGLSIYVPWGGTQDVHGSDLRKAMKAKPFEVLREVSAADYGFSPELVCLLLAHESTAKLLFEFWRPTFSFEGKDWSPPNSTFQTITCRTFAEMFNRGFRTGTNDEYKWLTGLVKFDRPELVDMLLPVDSEIPFDLPLNIIKLATENGRIELVRRLMPHFLSKSASTKQPLYTLAYSAMRSGHEHIMEYFIECGWDIDESIRSVMEAACLQAPNPRTTLSWFQSQWPSLHNVNPEIISLLVDGQRISSYQQLEQTLLRWPLHTIDEIKFQNACKFFARDLERGHLDTVSVVKSMHDRQKKEWVLQAFWSRYQFSDDPLMILAQAAVNAKNVYAAKFLWQQTENEDYLEYFKSHMPKPRDCWYMDTLVHELISMSYSYRININKT